MMQDTSVYDVNAAAVHIQDSNFSKNLDIGVTICGSQDQNHIVKVIAPASPPPSAQFAWSNHPTSPQTKMNGVGLGLRLNEFCEVSYVVLHFSNYLLS